MNHGLSIIYYANMIWTRNRGFSLDHSGLSRMKRADKAQGTPTIPFSADNDLKLGGSLSLKGVISDSLYNDMMDHY